MDIKLISHQKSPDMGINYYVPSYKNKCFVGLEGEKIKFSILTTTRLSEDVVLCTLILSV